jgi:hypothetical protein
MHASQRTLLAIEVLHIHLTEKVVSVGSFTDAVAACVSEDRSLVALAVYPNDSSMTHIDCDDIAHSKESRQARTDFSREPGV